MFLSEWLDRRGRGARKKLADAIGVEPSHITGLCNGSTWPSRKVARAIELYTEGEVTAADFVHLDPEVAA
jgi:DNA-binding transcriptional regulator YdaS (Cro superfamily)